MSGTNGRSAVVYDSHPLWVDAVAEVLGATGVRTAGRTTSVSTALSLVEEHAPDLLIMEIDADPSGAGELLRTARHSRPELKILVLSESDDADLISDTLAAGAFAFIVKIADVDDLAFAVRQAFEVSTYLARPNRVPANNGFGSNNHAPTEQLTRREVEILGLLSEGRANADIARALWVTEQTVKFHLSNVYRKLSVSNRTQAARWAQQHGLV